MGLQSAALGGEGSLVSRYSLRATSRAPSVRTSCLSRDARLGEPLSSEPECAPIPEDCGAAGTTGMRPKATITLSFCETSHGGSLTTNRPVSSARPEALALTDDVLLRRSCRLSVVDVLPATQRHHQEMQQSNGSRGCGQGNNWKTFKQRCGRADRQTDWVREIQQQHGNLAGMVPWG